MTHRFQLSPWPLYVASLTLLLVPTTLAAERADEPPLAPQLWAIERGVSDVERAITFYVSALGFEVISREPGDAWALLGHGAARLALAISDLPAAPVDSPRVYPNFTVGDLDIAARAVVAAGGRVHSDPRETAVGEAITVLDPFGNPANLIDHPWDEKGADSPPEVFNFGLNVESVETAESFLTALGFTVRTRDYLPETLVFELQGVAQLVLHPAAKQAADPRTNTGALWLDADSESVLAALGGSHRRVERTTPAPFPATSATVELRGPSGNLFKIARRTPIGGENQATISAEQAAAAFEQLKRLAGEWRARSTRGWDESVTYEVAARGSLVVETNTFTDAPESTMYTMFYLDGDRLLATHYCGSGNQPTLLATAVADDGKRVTFTYLGGTGLPSREHGHMDQAVFHFSSDDQFTSKWTWYEQGHEQWLEEIEHRRAPPRLELAANP